VIEDITWKILVLQEFCKTNVQSDSVHQ
jgi:hypothetical protein